MPTVDILRLQEDIRQALLKSLQNNGNIHLDTKDFFIVKKYIWMCIDLPSSATSFQAKHPRDDLRPYMTKDPSLYDGLAAQFPINHHQCQEFLDQGLVQVSELSRSVANFITQASLDAPKLYTLLDSLTKSSPGPSQPQTIQQGIHTLLSNLLSLAQTGISKADQTQSGLSKFESASRSSSASLSNLLDRWTKNVTSEQTLSDEERRAEESARKLQDAAREARDTATAQAKSAEDRRFLRWGLLAGGIVGTVVLATDLLTGPTLDELKDKASRAQRDYDGLLSLQREKKANFTRVKTELSNLALAVREANDSIKPAINAINAIRIALSLAETEFSKFRAVVQDLADEDEITPGVIENDLGDIEQLKNLDVVWKDLAGLCVQMDWAAALLKLK
ncbi:MAG: hypothetical protein HETSPECPRED_008568 [Heterodermia speciosa]|uniref:Uncharacterized protein n=1 Tax=Heterodermia speciosa TaxID=116794 RepID=A0A8H3FYA2_9LECA|nr:MAG: hypothetical protein HETSPECPRED_008568 [Heterodermia speciosa]